MKSQSAFMRGFIDDWRERQEADGVLDSLNPRSCAASSMTRRRADLQLRRRLVSIRVHARLHR